MFNTYNAGDTNLKINACSGGIYKTYKESWFSYLQLESSAMKTMTKKYKYESDENECNYKRVLEMNKILLKENEKLKDFKKQVTEIESTNFIKYKNYISKQEVKDKIEKLNKKEQKLQNSISDEEREEYSDANISWDLMDINIKREVLQELIEESE